MHITGGTLTSNGTFYLRSRRKSIPPTSASIAFAAGQIRRHRHVHPEIITNAVINGGGTADRRSGNHHRRLRAAHQHRHQQPGPDPRQRAPIGSHGHLDQVAGGPQQHRQQRSKPAPGNTLSMNGITINTGSTLYRGHRFGTISLRQWRRHHRADCTHHHSAPANSSSAAR